MPEDIKPMLATLVSKPLKEEGWIYEIKWDGFRAMAYLNNGNVEIRSRNNKNFNEKFYPVFDALKRWKKDIVVDGEIVVLNENGYPDFTALQTWRSEADGTLVYYLFDLLWMDGYNLMEVPLSERKRLLKSLAPKEEVIRVSDIFDVSGEEFFELASKLGMEGIIAKKADSFYHPDVRSKAWLKVKTQRQQEAVIAGYTRNENTSKKFSSLLLGVYENGELIPIAPVGTGFTVKMQEEILKRLRPLVTKKCPFAVVPDFNKPSRFRPDPPKAEITWVKPLLVAEVTYRTVASDGSLRHPSFKGLREDKEAKDVMFEKPVNTELSSENNSLKLSGKPIKKERKTFLNPKDETQVRIIGGHELKFTNLSKVFWPGLGITKRDMLNYYYQAAPFMLPYLEGRPQTLNRFPNGISGKSFYQKDVKGKVPEWMQTFKYYSEADAREKEFLVCSNEASLLYMANLGCIEFNPWLSVSKSPDYPSFCIIDLDPDKNAFNQVIDTACVTKDVLDSLGIPGYCKTSGSTGLHIYIPLGGKYTYEESKELGRALVKIIHAQIPDFTSIERLTGNRKGKIYLDFLQNRPQATVATAYSLRPKPNAEVSMPLHWEEVKKGLHMHDFTIFNAVERLKEQGDIFGAVLGKGVDIGKMAKKINKEFGIHVKGFAV